MTQKYLDEANTQLADATRRAADKRLEADTLEAAGQANEKASRIRADELAAEILANAEARGASLVAEAQERTDALVADAEERLAKIRIERDAVAGYFTNLRTVLTNAEQVASSENTDGDAAANDED